MVRSRWIGALAGVLSSLAPLAAEPFFKPDTVISVQEDGKPAQKCKVLRTWKERDGTLACEAQPVDGGRTFTVLAPKEGKPARIVHTAPPPSADNVVEAAPRSFWRESWGTTERWTEADTRKAQEESTRRAARATPPVARKETAEPLARPEQFTKAPVVSSEAPVVQTVARADTSLKVEPVPGIPGPAAPPGALLPGVTAPRPSLLARLGWSRPAPVEKAPSAPVAPRSHFGMASVSAAAEVASVEDQPPVVKGKPARMESPENAFARGLSLPGGPTVTTAGVPEGMSNAFTTGVTSRPIPSDFGIGFGQQPGAFAPRPGGPVPPIPPEFTKGMSPEVRAMMEKHHQQMMAQYMATTGGQPQQMPPQTMHPMMLQPAPAPVSVAQQSITPGLLASLREASLPSERQMAADQLRRVDWKSEPDVVPALLKSAREDAAPMVRVYCVRVLGQMKANTPAVVHALEQLKSDADERVRIEAAGTLSELAGKR